VAPDARLLSLLSAEARVLLLSAGDESNDAALRQTLGESLNWSRLASLAEWERATSVLNRRLARVAPGAVPQSLVEAWARLTMVADFHALHRQERCDATLGAFAREGIDGPMGDLDILVPEHRARDAWRIAIETGWEWDSEEFPETTYALHHHLPPLFDRRRAGGMLELHSRLRVQGHPLALDFDRVQLHARRLAAPRENAMVFDASLQLVNLAVHFAWSHLMVFGAWRTFRDLRALCDSGALDWDRVTELARDHQAAESCFWTLRLAALLTGLSVPVGVLEHLAPGGRSRSRRMERHLTSQLLPTERVCPSDAVVRYMWSKAMQPERVGTARPWDFDEVEQRRARRPKSIGRRAARHLRSAVAWWRYLQVVGTPGFGAERGTGGRIGRHST
jgi:hypothetical protein